MKKLLTCAVAMIASMPTLAQDHGTMWGAGATSCGKYVAMSDQHSDLLVTMAGSWLQGYLSSWNAYLVSQNHVPLRYADYESINAFALKFCRDNPLKNVSSVAVQLVTQLTQ